MSVVSIEEIYYGLTYKDAHRKKAWFGNFITCRCEALPVTIEIAQQCGIWRGQFRQQGITRSQADLFPKLKGLKREIIYLKNYMRYTGEPT